MNWSKADYQHMALALKLAEKGQYTARPNPMVGCVIVNHGEIVGQGWHQSFGGPHAEINALAQAGEQAVGATCYVTLEPCSHVGKTGPCAEALINAKVAKVISAMKDPNPKVSGAGFERLSNAGIETKNGLLELQAITLNKGFISKFEKNRPWITIKLAMSLDGRTAMADGHSQWITGKAARLDVQRLRARQDAIITGSGTLLADNPSLTVRGDDQIEWFEQVNQLADQQFRQPARILLDRSAKAKMTSKLFADSAEVWWNTDEKLTELEQLSSPENAHITNTNFHTLQALVQECAKQGMNQIMLEAGHRLAGAFIQQQLIDEVIVYMAPKLMGDKAMGLFGLEIEQLSDSLKLQLKDVRQFGDDLRLSYAPIYSTTHYL